MNNESQPVTPYSSPLAKPALKHYRKAFIAVVGVVLTGMNALYGNNTDVQLVISVATALGVYAMPNVSRGV